MRSAVGLNPDSRRTKREKAKASAKPNSMARSCTGTGDDSRRSTARSARRRVRQARGGRPNSARNARLKCVRDRPARRASACTPGQLPDSALSKRSTGPQRRSCAMTASICDHDRLTARPSSSRKRPSLRNHAPASLRSRAFYASAARCGSLPHGANDTDSPSTSCPDSACNRK